MKDLVAVVFFTATSLGILIGAYCAEQFDIWIVAALAVMALWKLWDRKGE